MPAPHLNAAHPHPGSEPGPGSGPSAGWRQLSVWCANWQVAEDAALTHLAPALGAATARGAVTSWWFVRKGPSWRIRIHLTHRIPDGHRDVEDVGGGGDGGDVVDAVTAALLASGDVLRVAERVYEPETIAFGGPAAMTVAHELFAADSAHVLDHLARTRGTERDDHRRELGLLLAGRMMAAAGLDWYEQGDVWHRLAPHRGAALLPPPSPRTVRAVGQLLTAAGDAPTSPLAGNPAWAAAHDRAGRAVAEIADTGLLARGLRAVLAHHLLFTFNRLGVPAEHQHILAAAASHYTFQENHHMTQPHPIRAADRTNDTDPARDNLERDNLARAAELRDGLADHIRGRGTFRTAAVQRAFRTVPRHLFLPGIDLADAYAPRPVITQRAANGTALSSASSPNLVAEMLELSDTRPGHRVLEIGAATGINAALLAELIGDTGHVVTVEIDPDLAAGARTALDTAGYHNVDVHCVDGTLGHPPSAPYDRIVVTAGAWDIPDAWWRQLAPGGRLVVPVRLHGSGLTRVLPLDHHTAGHRAGADTMVATSAVVCGFVPMRGAGAHPEHVVRLAADVVLAVDITDHPDQDALARALAHPTRQQWTGTIVGHDEAAEHLDLWLATTTAATADASDDMARFGRLSATRAARDAGIADPAMRWAGAALYRGGTLAYLTARAHTDHADELGITAHGPDSNTLADNLNNFLQQWNRHRPGQPTVTATRIHSEPDDAGHRSNQPGNDRPGRDAIVHARGDVVREHTRLTVTW